MHYFNDQVSWHIDRLQARICELEDKLASAELGYDVARDEVWMGRDRERRLLWAAVGLGMVAMLAIVRLAAMGS